MNPWPLPSTWHWAAWKDVASVASALVDPAGYPDLPHVAPNHIESQSGRLLPYRTIAEDGVTSPKHQFRSGQVLYSKIRPYLAKVVVADFEGLCSADMYPVDTELDARFLKWWMLHPEFTRLASGEQARTVLPKINQRALGKLPVPVPPVPEQRRIVASLEGHLSRLDAADIYMASASARIAGLVENLLSTELASVDCERTPFESLLEVGLANGRSVQSMEGGFPVLRLTALRDGRIDLTERKEGAWTKTEAERFLVQSGDFLISRGNGSLRLVGRGGLVNTEPDAVAFPDTLIRARPDAGRLLPEFLALVWNARAVRIQIEAAAKTTAGIYKVSQRDLKAMTIPVPAIDDQRQIVQKIAAQQESANRLGETLRASRQRAESLRRALLSAAFSGHLTDVVATAGADAGCGWT